MVVKQYLCVMLGGPARRLTDGGVSVQYNGGLLPNIILLTDSVTTIIIIMGEPV